MYENIIAGIIANIIFFVLLIAIGWSLFLIARRRKLLKFFGIGQTKRITVYLSNIRVLQGSSVGTDGKQRAYAGTTVTFGEAVQANLFPNLFSYFIPGLTNQPGFLKYLLVSDVKVVVLPSPLREEDIDRSSSIVTFGSPGYNVVSQWAERKLVPRIKFSNDNVNITVDGLPDITDGRQSFVQRLYDSENKRWVFLHRGNFRAGHNWCCLLSRVAVAQTTQEVWRARPILTHHFSQSTELPRLNHSSMMLHTLMTLDRTGER
ncbi:MAG: hypothetical protein HZC52_02170 [Planctomycetes bacterium]|uniref:hypothetical protein n=1 Tax=Candidatus Wunengus sp. YC65 TaxID=3367701 RepID=UPI001D4DB6B2|nr:hypothetical protein [Planctomycetota bacterium]